MDRLWHLNLIHFLDFYLMFFFVLSTARYFSAYWTICSIAWGVPGRWPKLLQLLKEHATVFLTWATLLPGLLVLLLSVVQLIASRVIWSSATVTAGDLAEHWFFLIFLVPAALAMI